MKQTVLIDNEYCAFTVKYLHKNTPGVFTLETALENKTDKTLMFALENAFVNGCPTDPHWAVATYSGLKFDKEFCSIVFKLPTANTDERLTLNFELRVYDIDDASQQDLAFEKCEIICEA